MSLIKISLKKNLKNTNIKINDSNFVVLNHWFWDKFFTEKWEPQTVKFFKSNLEKGRDFLDIGAWIGPTSLIATALGARKIKIIEPNPMSFFHLLAAQLNNGFFSNWFLVNACVSKNFGSEIIGPLKGIANSSSATSIINQTQGASVLSLKLSDLILDKDDFSVIKIDIEGAEAYIIDDISVFSKHSSAIWLSIHPPFFKDKKNFLKKLFTNSSEFYFVDENNKIIEENLISTRVLSDEKFPIWGTNWGNFFEIGLLPKRFFDIFGNRIKTK